jgi:cyanate permease
MTLAIMGASVGAIAGVPLLLLVLARLGLARGLAVAGIVAVLILLPLVWGVLRYRGPADLGLARDGEPPGDRTDASLSRPPPIARRGRPRVLLWTAGVGFAFALTVQIGFITHHVALASPILGTAGAGWLVSATGASAFAGRLILASIVDRADVRLLAIVVMLVQTVALTALAVWQSVPVLVVASLVYGYGIGHITTLAPVIVRREFGAEAFGATYGSAATVIQFTSAMGPALLGVLRDGFDGYAPGLGIAAGVTMLACTSLLAGRHFGLGAGETSRPA